MHRREDKLKGILKKHSKRVWTGLTCLKIGTSGRMVGSYEHGYETPGSIKGKKFLNQLSNY
jgi:hypothetical protein